MMHAKISKGLAEDVKGILLKTGSLDRTMEIQHMRSYVYFPVVINGENTKKLLIERGCELVDLKGVPSAHADVYTTLKRELGTGKTGIRYDILGSTAILNAPGFMGDARILEIAEALRKASPNIKTVLARKGAVTGEYRTRDYRHICGRRSFQILYKENNCIFSFDVRKTFFSSRLSFERNRIAEAAIDGEKVMVMFAGVGPFAIEIAKRNPHSEIVAIELNPYAYRQMVKNIKLNKTPNVKALLGDVRDICNRYVGFADRVVMPLPKISVSFLDQALLASKDNGIVHIYSFLEREEGVDKLIGLIREHGKANSYGIEVLFSREVRPYSASEIEVVVDYRIIKKVKEAMRE
ncbi:MAG: class I SAM-dependent methyltransferase family protein [Candidatus Micrarchaeaceae archaeon]